MTLHRLSLAAETDVLGAESFIPPQKVRDNAKRALEVRAEKPESQRGMTEVGVARARDLSNGRAVSIDTIKRMISFFQRHEVDKKAKESWSEKGKGWQAWYGWGGDEGWSWARGVLRQYEADKKKRQSARASVMSEITLTLSNLLERVQHHTAWPNTSSQQLATFLKHAPMVVQDPEDTQALAYFTRLSTAEQNSILQALVATA